MMNTELARYQAVTTSEVLEYSAKIFDEANSNTLYYYSEAPASPREMAMEETLDEMSEGEG
jgi:hypothetical protein